ncbi:MAG: type III pantothenate kinase [Candidatus Omnitrophota bacterium]
MLLAINVGNTNISSAIFSSKHKIVKQFSLPTKSYSKTQFAKKIKPFEISDTVICSVVPGLSRILQQDLKLSTGKKPYIIGKELIVPIKNLYHNPKQLGQDRLINAYAACTIYSCPAVIIDSGTAITFDVVSKNKTYLGGLIAPGMELALKALREKTALLPQIKLQAPKGIICRDTKNSILSGVVFGIAGLCKELIGKIKKSAGREILVLGTGGNICLIKKYSGIKIKIDKNLTLKGILLAYENKLK